MAIVLPIREPDNVEKALGVVRALTESHEGSSRFFGCWPTELARARIRITASRLRGITPAWFVEYVLRKADELDATGDRETDYEFSRAVVGRVESEMRRVQQLRGERWGLCADKAVVNVIEAEIERLGGTVPWKDEEDKEEDRSGEAHRDYWERFLSGPVGHPF